MLQSTKTLVETVSPDLFHALKSLRFFLQCRSAFKTIQDDCQRRVYGDGPITVLSGPFRGLLYYNRIIWGPITPKWFGTYEMELHPAIEKIIAADYRKIIDVGAAEGFYAVGLAWKKPDCAVISFDVDPIARHRQVQLAELNAVNNLDIRRYCSHADLENLADSQSLIVCDIEGFESVLVDRAKAPNLAHADLLIETHRFGDAPPSAVRDKIVAQFQDSHRITIIPKQPRDAADLRRLAPELAEMDDEILERAMDEHRGGPPQEWLWMEATGGIAEKSEPPVVDF